MKHDRFHGRVNSSGRLCDWPGCTEKGEFRAPGVREPGFDGPGDYRWFCLDHIREFNARYDFFQGMSSEEILAAHSPLHGWDRESRSFRPDGGAGQNRAGRISPIRWTPSVRICGPGRELAQQRRDCARMAASSASRNAVLSTSWDCRWIPTDAHCARAIPNWSTAFTPTATAATAAMKRNCRRW